VAERSELESEVVDAAALSLVAREAAWGRGSKLLGGDPGVLSRAPGTAEDTYGE
jgi:hypothetical protein